jgi:hypothetical protein
MRYIVGVFGVILLAILAIVLIFTRSSSTGPRSNASVKAPVVIKLLDQDNADSRVKVTTQGRLVGEDQRRSIRITVSQSQRTIEVIQGYENNVIKSQSFSNTPAAYSTFLRAINDAGFTKYRKGANGDERGACPQGQRYIYELNKGSERLQRLWGTSCTSNEGSLIGNGARIRQIFQDQIPGYSHYVLDVNLSQLN